MQKLYKEIGNMIEENGIPFNAVARFIESTKSELSDYLHGTKGLGFRKFLGLSILLYPNNSNEVMENWCLRFNTTESIKQSFEYASATRNKPLLKKLLDKFKGDKSLEKYIAIYSVLYGYYTFEYEADELIERLEKVGHVKGELAILVDIIKCYNYYYIENYPLMLQTAKMVEKSISKLSDRQLFIKECYLHRVAEILGNVSLYLNDLDATRYYSSLIINANICAKTVSDAYYLLGMTFLSEDKHKCINYLQTRYELSQKVGDINIENNARRDLDFAKLYLGIQLDTDSAPALINLQNNKGSELELKYIKEAIFQQGDDDFLTLITALAKGTLKHIHDCRKKFFQQNNYFFTSVAAREAKKMGEESEMIDEFIEHKTIVKGDVEFEENYIRCFNRSSSYCRSISA